MSRPAAPHQPGPGKKAGNRTGAGKPPKPKGQEQTLDVSGLAPKVAAGTAKPSDAVTNDGSGTRPAKPKDDQNKGKGKGKGGGKSTPPADADLYAQGMAAVSGSFAPQITAAKQTVADLTEQNRAGGAVDQAYDQSQAQTRGIMDLLGQISGNAAAGINTAGAAAQGIQQQLGEQQAGFADRQQQLYGQSAGAAEVRARAGAAGQQLAGQAANAGAVVGSDGFNTAAAYGFGGLAAERERQLTHEDFGRQIIQGKQGVADLKGQRNAAAAQSALGQLKDQRDFELAVASINADKYSDRLDYKAALAGLQTRIQEAKLGIKGDLAVAGANNAADLAINDADNAADAAEGAADRATRVQIAKIGAKSRRQAAAAAAKGKNANETGPAGKDPDGDGYVPYNTGSGPKSVTQGQFDEAMTERSKIMGLVQHANELLTSGKDYSQADLERLLGRNDPRLEELVLSWAAHRQQKGQTKDIKGLIDPRFRSYLASLFPHGIPQDIAARIGR